MSMIGGAEHMSREALIERVKFLESANLTLGAQVAALNIQVKELGEYKWMYEDLCK